MSTLFAHALVGVTAARLILGPTGLTFGKAVAAAILAMLPDADVVGFRFGVHYADLVGHRGLTHSVLFALVVAVLVTSVFFRESLIANVRTFIALFVAMALHGVLDAFTNGGLGVAFFAPLSNLRVFFPWRPLEVSPIGVGKFFTGRGVEILWNEILWVGLPCVLILVFLRFRKA